MMPFKISLTKLKMVIVSTLFLFLLLSFFVIQNKTLTTDTAILNFFIGSRFPAFNELFLFLTYLGSVSFVFLATSALSLVLILQKKYYYFLHLFLSVIGTTGMVILLKQIFGRLRPDQSLSIYTETSFSFPSGHTALTVVLYGTIAYILSEKWSNHKYRINFVFGWIFFMVMIGFSRVYLGVHYASDVLGGYLLGFFCLSLGIFIFEKFAKK